ISSTTVIQDNLNEFPPDFIEFDQALNSGNIEFHTNHTSQSFLNTVSSGGGFTFEQNGIKRPLIYSASSDILGTTVNGNILGMVGLFNVSQVTGPYCAPGDYSLEVMDKYSRGYLVTQEMIETHLSEITAGNPNYKIPFGIREWPAHGDATLGQAANLAGFFDQNGNGIYEPELGDYPSIYGDQCLLNIYHQHPNSPNSASIETHQYYFTFDCDSSETLNNTVFIRTDNFTRNQTFFNAYEGDRVDFEIGSPFDDYIGTNVELGMIYGYNADNNDASPLPNTGFNDTIPAAGMIALQGLNLQEDGIDNFTTYIGGVQSNGIGFADGIVDNEYFTLESSYSYDSPSGAYPTDLVSMENVMKGLYPDGLPKSIGNVDIRHDYFGSSDPLFYSSFGTDHGNDNSELGNLNPSGDRRMSSASGPGLLIPTDTAVLLKAYVVGVDAINLSPSNSVDRLFEHGQVLRDAYAQNALSCGNTFDTYVSSSVLSVEEETVTQIVAYPNPANQQIQFNGITGVASITIFDLNGRIVIYDEGINDHQAIDVSPLDKAVYFIQIDDENGSQTIRMIKQ
ncbi:MAG: T9SS type A sorting domain-containing protein, partial [Crocinitomicaceae bacterium]